MLYDLLRCGKYCELLDNCSIILTKNPLNLKALKYKAYALYFLGRYEEAIFYYDRAIKFDPEDPSSYAGKSKVLEKLGRWQEAKLCFEQAKKIGSEKSDLGHNNHEWGC